MYLNDILQAVEACIQARYPGEPVYRDSLPKGFERPSFALECVKEEQADVNIGLVRRSATVSVLCFVEVDAYGDSSREALNQRQEGILAIFGRGALAVGDRSIAVSARKGEGDPTMAAVSAVFAWTDARPGYKDPEAQTPETGGAPLMEHYSISNGKE